MIDSGVYDSSGNLKNGTQADLYQKGLENQSRIGMNKTIGVGKEDLSGQAGVDKMNAIQYGAQAGVQGEIAQGQSLKNVYGIDLKGTKQSRGLSYSQTAEINADMQNMKSASTAKSAQEQFSDVSGGKGETSYSDMSYSQADKSHRSTIGDTKAYDKARKDNPNIEGELAESKGDRLYGTFNSSIEAAKEAIRKSKLLKRAAEIKKDSILSDMTDKEAMQVAKREEELSGGTEISRKEIIDFLNASSINAQATDSTKGALAFEEKLNQGIANQDGSMNLDANVTTNIEKKDEKGNVIKNEAGKTETVAVTENYADALVVQTQYRTGDEIGQTVKTKKALDQAIDQASRDMADNYKKAVDNGGYSFSKMAAAGGSEALRDAAVLGTAGVVAGSVVPGVGNVTAGAIGAAIGGGGGFLIGGAKEAYNQYQNNNDPIKKADFQKKSGTYQAGMEKIKAMREAFDSAQYGDVGVLGAMSDIKIGAGGMISNFTGTGEGLQGGSQSGVSYSHNESSNYSYGVTASGGSAFAGMAHSMGMNMGAFASMSSNLAAASQVAGLAAMALPGGRLGGMLSNIGAISADSTYAMGVGSAVKARRGEASSAINQMGKLQDGIVEARTNFNEAKMNYTASGGKRWEHFSDEQAQAHFAGIKRALGERQERLQYLQSNEGPAVQIRAVKEQISDLTKERSQMDSLLKYRTAEQKYTAAQNNFNNGINSLGDYGRTAWEQNPYNIERRSQFKTEEGIRTGEQMRFQEGVEAGIGRKTAVSNRLDVDGAKSLGFEGQKR